MIYILCVLGALLAIVALTIFASYIVGKFEQRQHWTDVDNDR